MSPRRSSRARNTNPPPPPVAAQATGSSASSISSGRTRSHNKVASPQTSAPRSQSLEDTDDVKPPPRRTRSGLDEVQAAAAGADHTNVPTSANATAGDGIGDEEEEDEEEVTRCVCGQLEYPGLATPIQEELKQSAKLNGASTPEDGAEEGSGIFIQCDICKVWQHGGCVGILDDDSAPEEYFCEECRKDLHYVSTTSTGQRYSRYRPIHEEPSPPNSPPPTTRETRKTKENKPRASAEALAVKRRPTMNSYDEQEQLRRAIEESKREGIAEEKKRPKRGRTDSEDGSPSKRQRTGSHSPNRSNAVSSSDEALAEIKHDTRNGRETRNKETKDPRSSVDPKRKARRRGEDSPESPQQQPSGASSPPNGADEPRPAARSHKKGASKVSAVSKSRRAGRSGLAPSSSLANTLDPGDAGGMRTRTRSRSHSRAPESPPQANGAGNGTNGTSVNGHGSAAGIGMGGFMGSGLDGSGVTRPSRPKHMNPNRTSLNEMKKRVAGILEFVTKAQEEADKVREGSKDGDGEGTEGARESPKAQLPTAPESAEFAALPSDDMLRNLRNRLVGWESQYGRWGARA